MVSRCIRMFGALACLLVLLPGSAALAANEAEPNDTLPGADRQPALLDGAIVVGGLATLQDVDAFRVELGQGVVELSARFENTSDPAIDPNIEIGIADARGYEVFTDAPFGGVSTSPSTADLRAPLRGPGTFYVYARFFCDGSSCLFTAPGQTTYGLRIKAPLREASFHAVRRAARRGTGDRGAAGVDAARRAQGRKGAPRT